MKFNQTSCPVEVTLSLISDKWKVLIIYELISGTKRHGEIKRALNKVSQKVLTENLKSMEVCGLLSRVSYMEMPLRVEYSLTSLGDSLLPILNSMFEWGTTYLQNVRTSDYNKLP